MSCPFRHLWPGRAPAADAGEAAPAPDSGGCPFSSKAAATSSEQPAAAVAASAPGVGTACAAPAPSQAVPGPKPGDSRTLEPATPSSSAGQCPFLAGMGGVALGQPAAAAASSGASSSHGGAPAGDQGANPPVCPLGFGGSQGPRLGQFHCLLCKSLFCDCVVTSCGHRYCAGCVQGARDCPACGADIESLEPDEETQALVERYIDAHAGSHTLWELEGPAGGTQQVDGMAGERGRTSFLLQLGLRAIAAGNIGAARRRFLACQSELEAALATAAAPDRCALRCRLGAVAGCLGDCCRGEGDAAGTLSCYQRSVELLQAAGSDPEAQQALSVALNKVGELRHVQGELQEAADYYGQALELRRGLLAAAQRQAGGQAAHDGCLQAGHASEGVCAAALDLAASCLKLAAARRECGHAAAAAQELLREAAELLRAQEAGLGAQPQRLQRKHASLAGVVHMLAAQA